MLSRERRHHNCVYNREHLPRKLPYSLSDVTTELDLAPRRVTTLVVIQEDKPVRLCAYGCDAPADWQGNSRAEENYVCDSDSVSADCSLFEPLLGPDEAVYENFRDLAVLQWVLEDRNPRLPWYRRLLTFLFGGPVRPPETKLLPPGASAEVDRELEDLWK